jgi:tetratricopeptide (TPR) repeat protein
MKVLAVSAGLIAGITLAVAGPAFGADSKKNTNSEKVAKLLKPAQEMLASKKYADALAKIHEAAALSDKTPFDAYTISEFGCSANIGAANYADAAKVCEEKLNSSFMPDAEKPQLVKTLLALNYQIKNYDKSIEFGTRAVKDGYATEENRNILAQAYYLKGDWKDTARAETELVDSEIKAGQTPKEQQLSLVLNSCIKMEDQACQQKALEREVTYYPKPELWAALLSQSLNQTSGNDALTLQTFRLMFEVHVLKDPSNYNEMAQLAVDAGSPGEAQKVLEEGFSTNVFSDQRQKDRNTRLLEVVKKTAATDQASLPKTEKEAETSATGAKNAGVGLAYFGYGQYDKAIDELNKALTKGGLKDDNQTRLLLGISQLKAGHKDDAIKTFHSVKGDPNLEKLAGFWVLHARSA